MSNIDGFCPLFERRGLPKECLGFLKMTWSMASGWCPRAQAPKQRWERTGFGGPQSRQNSSEPLRYRTFPECRPPIWRYLVSDKRHAAPESPSKTSARWFNNVINQDSPGQWSVDSAPLHDQSGSFACLRGVGCAREPGLVLAAISGVLQNMASFFLEFLLSQFLDPQNVVFGQKFGDHLHHFSGKANIFSFFWIDADHVKWWMP